jgi:TonB family protein
MPQDSTANRHGSVPALARRAFAAAAPAALLLACTFVVSARQNAPQQEAPATPTQNATPQNAAPQEAAPQEAPPAPASAQTPTPVPAPPSAQPIPARPAAAPEPGITEDEIKQMLVGKELYLRGGYLDDSIAFNEHGKLIGHSAQGSYTLCGIQIDKVRLTRHKLELEGSRYGLHFLGALPYEDPTKAVDRVRITPRKKVLKITIDRELVVKPKVKKEKGRKLEAAAKPATPAPGSTPASAPAVATAAPAPAAGAPAAETASITPAPAPAAPPTPAAGPDNASAPSAPASTPESASATPENASATPAGAPAATPENASANAQAEEPDTDEAKQEIAAAKPDERPADPDSVTATTSPAHAAKLLKSALDQIFSVGLDDRMMAAMPDFWKLYYQAAAAHTDFRPADATVLRQNTVDSKARLLTTFEPASNEFAQSNGVAGMALYHAVIGPDGRPGEIAVARPIGFGLDESAVDSIRKARFEPAQKEGKPVPVMLDLVVQFRIYSKRTSVSDAPPAQQAQEVQKPTEPVLPGPYSLEHPPQQAQQ